MKILSLILLFTVGAFAASRPSNDELNQILKTEKVIGLDIRTREEVKTNPAPGSINIPLDELEIETPEQIPDKNMRIFLFCESGRRAKQGKMILDGMGYTKVINILSWRDWNQLDIQPSLSRVGE